MQSRWTQGRRTHLWVTLLLLPALLSRVLVPAGFMPGTGADDTPTMRMCHGAGPLPQLAQSPAGDDGQAPGNRGHHEAPCVFAAAGTVAPPPITLPILDGVALPVAVAAQPEAAVVHRVQHRAHSPRAPPAPVRPA